MNGPYFDKAWQRDAYEAELIERERELLRLGRNFRIPESNGVSKAAYKPKKRKEVDPYNPPRNYTPEENAERAKWRGKAMDDARPCGYKKISNHGHGRPDY